MTRMGELKFSPEADEALGVLRVDARRSQLYERINDALDAIEDDPHDHRVRRRAYRQPPVWGTPVYGSGEDWLILWSESESGSLVHYIGRDLA